MVKMVKKKIRVIMTNATKKYEIKSQQKFRYCSTMHEPHKCLTLRKNCKRCAFDNHYDRVCWDSSRLVQNIQAGLGTEQYMRCARQLMSQMWQQETLMQ